MKPTVVRAVFNVLIFPVVFPVIFVLGGIDACFGTRLAEKTSNAIYGLRYKIEAGIISAETMRGNTERKNRYRIAKKTKPYRDCLSCAASSSEPAEPYDRLHCFEMPEDDDVVDEDMVCDKWKN
jgi:hypothetical protein